MPSGRYLVGSGAEEFSCAPGPAGWRYVSGVLDLTLDSAGRTLRVVVRCAGREVRGGRTELGVTWLDTAAGARRERHAEADGFAAASPGLLLAAARRVAAPGERPASATLRQVLLSAPHLAALLVTRRWSRLGATRHGVGAGSLLVETWQVDDLDTGVRHHVHLAGDVVLAADYVDGADPGHESAAVELDRLDGPPSGYSGGVPQGQGGPSGESSP